MWSICVCDCFLQFGRWRRALVWTERHGLFFSLLLVGKEGGCQVTNFLWMNWVLLQGRMV